MADPFVRRPRGDDRSDRGIEEVEYEDAEPVRLTRSFLESRARFLDELLRD